MVFDEKKYMRHKESARKYRDTHKEYISNYNEGYRKSHRKQIKEYCKAHTKQIKEYRKAHKKERKEYCDIHREQRKKYDERYRKTGKGKIRDAKSRAKRKRDFGFNIFFKCPFADSELFDWHHINNNDVVAIPRDLHHQYMGKFHRENTLIIIKQIYKDWN